MKAKSETHSVRYEFIFSELDTLVEVEPHCEQVIIRVTRDSFSEQRKDLFVRYLIEEGFIDESAYWSSSKRIEWRLDRSWPRVPELVLSRGRQWGFGLFAISAVCVGFFLAGLFGQNHEVATRRAKFPAQIQGLHGK